jgi:hypothetical protein
MTLFTAARIQKNHSRQGFGHMKHEATWVGREAIGQYLEHWD